MTEYTPDGENIAELEWGMLIDHNAASYRGFKMNWTAKPFWPPSIATDGGTRVYLSWNGATEVKRWAVVSSVTRFYLPLCLPSRKTYPL